MSVYERLCVCVRWLLGSGRDAMWTSWWDQFAYFVGAYFVYSHLPFGWGLVVNHADRGGVHYSNFNKGDDAVLLKYNPNRISDVVVADGADGDVVVVVVVVVESDC